MGLMMNGEGNGTRCKVAVSCTMCSTVQCSTVAHQVQANRQT